MGLRQGARCGASCTILYFCQIEIGKKGKIWGEEEKL
jgi:hypothetical protein